MVKAIARDEHWKEEDYDGDDNLFRQRRLPWNEKEAFERSLQERRGDKIFQDMGIQ